MNRIATMYQEAGKDINMLRSKNQFFLVFLLLLLPITACTPVGPDYRPPALDPPDAWHASLPPDLTVQDSDSLADQIGWWEELSDPMLTELIRRAIANNLDLKKAYAAVVEARARQGQAEAGYWPTVDAAAAYTSSKSSENMRTGASSSAGSGTEVREQYSVDFDASWEIDLFGGRHRLTEAAMATYEAIKENYRAIMVSLLAEVAVNYVELRTIRHRLRIAGETVPLLEEVRELTELSFRNGLVSRIELEQATANLAEGRSRIHGLQSEAAAAENRLAILLGLMPGGLVKELAASMPIPVPPATIVIGIPADVVRQRPDIRQTERELAAQSANVGVAMADLWPQLTISGSLGLASISTVNLIAMKSLADSIGPRLAWNVFDGNGRQRNIEAQNAVLEQKLAAYQGAVLNGLEEAENALTAYAGESGRLEDLVEFTRSYRETLDLAQSRFTSGVIDYRELLDSRRILLSAEDQLASGQGTVTTNLITLYKALGGGWDHFAEGQ